MRPRRFIETAVLCLCLTAAVRAEPVKDPASLMPAETLAYAELRQPGLLVKEFAGLFEGTALGNVPDSLSKLWGKEGEGASRQPAAHLSGFGLLLSPEMLREAERIQGAAVALTGFKDGHPQFVAVVLPGESNGPAFAMRAFLTFERVKVIGESEGVKLYQYNRADIRRPPAERPKNREQPARAEEPVARAGNESDEPAFAMMPGALFIGSPDAVKDAIRRAKGNARGTSLAGVKNYRETSKEIGGQPGLFAYLDLQAALAAAEKNLPHAGKDEIATFKAVGDLVGLKAFRSISYSIGLDRGTLRYRELVLLDPKEKAPLLSLLPAKPVNKELLHFTPTGTVAAAAMSNDGGAERWAGMVELLDGFVKLTSPKAAMPSEEIAKAEKALGIDFGKDVMGKISGFSVALGDPLKAPIKRIEEKGEKFRRVSTYPELPMVAVIQAADEEAAAALIEKVLPKVYGAVVGKEDVKAAAKEMNGQKVHTLPVNGAMGLHYGRSGRTIVLGAFPQPVAQALGNGSREKGWLSDPGVAARAGEFEGAVYLMAMKPATMAIGAMMPIYMSESRSAPSPRPPASEKRQRAPALAPPEIGEESLKLPKELTRLLEKEELLVIRVTRKEGRILEEGSLPGLKSLVGPLVDVVLQQLVQEPHVRPKTDSAPSPKRRE